MKNILIVFTGGTFSSQTTNHVMDVKQRASNNFLKLIEEKYAGKVAFRVICPIFMLSENMYPESWSKITDAINDNLDETLDGIIVIHGSDTVCYTASFLSYYYSFLNIPLVVTAANAPIFETHSNGLNNFDTCVSLMMTKRLSNTYFIYQQNQNKGRINIYQPNELRSADIYTDDFSTIHAQPFGYVDENKIVITRDEKTAIFKTKRDPFVYNNKVLGIQPYTGLNYDYLLLSDDIKAVVHGVYHSNTFNCNAEHPCYSMIAFIQRCKKHNIDFYLCDFTTDRLDKAVYGSTDGLIKKGAKIIPLPFECAYAKAIYAYNSNESDKSDFLCNPS